MDWRVEFDGSLERKEIPEIPVDAAREAVINAFAHRLIESGQSVEVAIYRSFMEIYSPGKFPDGVTPEMFIREIRKPIRRNPLITRTLYYSKDMESFATGLKRIQDACDEAGCKVEYYGDEYGFTVRFYRHCGEGWGTDMANYEYYRLMFGNPENVVESRNNPETLVKELLADGKEIPGLYLAIGTEDFLYEENQIFRRFLEKEKVPFVYRESAGTHDFVFWNQYLEPAVKWMLGEK